jgi:hypothetical protein
MLKFIKSTVNPISLNWRVYWKTTFKNMSRYIKESEKYFNGWYKIPFNFFKLNSLLLFQSLFISKDLIVALDASFIPKSGKKTDGLGKFYNGSAQVVEKGLEISLLSLVDIKTGLLNSKNNKYRNLFHR